MGKSKFLLLAVLLALSSLLLALYSFSQVDLNLTLSTHLVYQSFQKQLTYLGYFNRPLSTAIYIFIVLLLAISYWLLAKAIQQKTVNRKQIWLLIGLTVVILLPSYPAFSHDIFNYMFDARIVTKYNLSPWHYKALDFPADEWIRFMRWTHRPSVYPPIWIGLSLIPSLLGFGKFAITLGLFKLLAAAAYLGSCSLIYKIAQRFKTIQPSNRLAILSLFAFNPLVVVESLVNAHMEIVMTFFALLAVNLALKNRKLLKWLTYVASIGIKFMTFYLALALIKGAKFLRYSVWLGMAITLAFIAWYGFQPWYILWVLPFVLLLPRKNWEVNLLLIASVSALFWNIPLVLSGDFDLPHWTNRLLYVVIPFGVYIIFLNIKKLIFK